MVSPNLMKKQEEAIPAEINESAKKLFQVIFSEQNKKEEIDDDIPKIKVSSLISKVAFFYEKIRNAVQYDEEHLLRKNAISRILRRQVIIEGVLKEVDSEGLSTHLLTELIRAGYLPNNKIPEVKIKEISLLLEKYIYLKDSISEKINFSLTLKTDIKKAKDLIEEKNDLSNWILTMAACEIEENLAPNKIKQTVVNSLFDILSKNIALPDNLPYQDDLSIQIYLSIGRTYLKLDEEALSFVLFKYYYGDWLKLGNEEKLNPAEEEKIKKMAEQISVLRNSIKNQLNHPLIRQVDEITRVYSLYFSVLTEAIESDPVKVYSELQKSEKLFIANLRKVCTQRYKKAKSRLWRAAIRSIIYIFLTKSIFVIAIELPAVKWFGEAVNTISLAINIDFPAILLFFIVLMTKTPRGNNTVKIINGIKEISFIGQEKKQALVLRKPIKRKSFSSIVFGLIYFSSFIASIYFVIWLLNLINFNWVSIIIFLFFLAFVSFFSIVVTKGVKELIIVERKENILTFLVDLFYMPIIIAGKWLSRGFSKLNVFIFIFDFILEAPFKILVEIADDWTKYVRERRENME